MSQYLSIKNKSGIFESIPVSKEVWDYVNQLECYIKNPKNSKLFDAYPGRFEPFKNFNDFCIIEETKHE